jgi:hypothetical protein
MRAGAVIIALTMMAAAAPLANAGVTDVSSLAMPRVAADANGAVPQLILAQRTIDRTWGLEDSAHVEKIQGLRSEGLALVLSAAVPGAGQVYSGEHSGFLFALLEVAGWTTHLFYKGESDKQGKNADHFAGAPTDTASNWNYARWMAGDPNRDPSQLEALYASDRDAYYNLISRDPSYLDGWSGSNPASTAADFQHFRDLSSGDLQRARYASGGLVLNHLASALDALRAARIHNLPIRENYELRLKSSWRRGSPDVVAILVRHF